MENTAVEFDPFRQGEIARIAPSTEPQREIFTSARMSDEANTSFNEAVSLRVSGKIDSYTIENALRTVVDRHDALRVTFTRLGDELVVGRRSDFRLERLDPVGPDSHSREAAIQALWRELVSTPMNLEEGRLFRALWIQLGENSGELILLAHHIICDGWSFYVILEELSKLCSGTVAAGLPEAPSYADFSEKQSARAVSNADVDFWVKRFESLPPVLDLPTDRVRPAIRTFAAERIDRVFDNELVKSITVAAGKLKASVVNVALAGTAALLHRLTDSTDLAIGLPVARQSSDGLPGLVGHAVQLLPIRIQMQPGDSFGDLVRQAKSATLDAREHFDFTFGTLIQNLKLSGDPSRVPLVPVIFNIDQPFGQIKLGAATATLRTVPRTAENFEIFLNVLPEQDKFTVEATYNSGLFSPETIRSWLAALENLLADAAANPTKAISALSLTPGCPDIYATLNDTAKQHPDGLWLDRFARNVSSRPDAVAIASGNDKLTYAELARRSDELAQVLLQHGATPGSVVGIYMRRSCELLVALTAVHKAGAAYLPLDPGFPESRLQFMVSDSGTQLLLADLELPAPIAEMQLKVIQLPIGATGSATRLPAPVPVAEDLAYIIYTSGSTGKPKGVEVRHGGVVNFFDSMAARPGFESTDTLLAVTTLSFDISVLELFLPLTQGGRVVIATRDDAMDAGKLAGLLSSHDVTVMQATPSTWRLLIGNGWSGRKNLTALCGGEALSSDLSDALLQRVKALWNMYGPTETTIWSSCTQVTAPKSRITIGHPIDNTTIYVMDSHGQALPTAVPGEIWIGGAGLARSYHARPDLTKERFVDHPQFGRLYRTGDRGRILPNGSIEHLGRIDFQVKVRGYRIELGEIEVNLASHQDVAQAVVITREDQPGDVRLVAYLVAKPGAAPMDSELRAHLKASLPDYMVPQHFMKLESIPLLPNGKLDRNSLPSPSSGSGPSVEHVAARTDLERSVVGAMEGILSRTGIGIHDSFFALGGHSLLASQLAVRLGKELDLQIPMLALFEAPTPAQLAGWIESRKGADAAAGRWIIARRPDRTTAPLSLMQQRIWFLEQLDPGRAVYNVPAAYRLRGAMDEAVFERAFSEMVRRQDSLRTVIDSVGTTPMQIILPEVASTLLPAEDLRKLPHSDRENELRDRINALIAMPFDLASPPLFRTRLFRLDEQEYAFVFVTHHIIWDGWSFDLIYKEMSALYGAFMDGKPSPLPELAIAYGDFSAWHREWMQGEELARQLAFWKQRLIGAPEALALPTDHPRPPVMSGEGRTEWIRLSAATAERVRDLAGRADATLFITMLATYILLLHQLSGQRDIIVGTPVRGRHVAELEPVMGFFVNALPMRFRVDEGVTFLQLLRHVRDTVMEAFKHPDVPFEQLVHELNVARDESRFPVYQAMFSFQDVRQRQLRWGNLDLSRIEVMQKGAAQDLGLWVVEMTSGIAGGLAYNAEIVSEKSARTIVERYESLLGAVLDDPEFLLDRLPIPVAEMQRLAEWNATGTDFDRGELAHGLIEAQAVLTPEGIAVQYEEETLTYSQLDARASRLANALRARGAARGRLVGLCLERGIGMLVAQLAILKSGAAYVPLDPAYPRDRLAYMAEDAGLVLNVTQSALQGLFDWPLEKTVCIDADAAAIEAHPDTSPSAGELDARADDPAYVIYTSGSTGKPKGVQVPHKAVVNFLLSMQREPGMSANDRLVATTTLSFDIAVLELLLPLTVGARVVLAGRETALDGQALVRLIESCSATVMQATPATWRLLIGADWKGGPSFKALCGGEALGADLAQQLVERTGSLWNMYGPTETTVWSTCWRVEQPARGMRIGRPIANTSIWVLDENRNPSPIGVPGEIWIGGEGVTLGYIHRADLTAERFVADKFSTVPGARLYRTGDRGRWGADGLVEHLGRLDDQVKVRGFRIELAEIESALADHPDVRQAAVHLWTVKADDVRIVACCVPEKPGILPPISLRKHLRTRLPEYMIPQYFLSIEEIPLTPNGKVARRLLPTPAVTENRSVKLELPSDPAEAAIAEVWTELLHPARPIGRADRFFEMGGHSLLVVEAVHRINKRLGSKLDLRALFQHNLAEVAALCRPERFAGANG